jgi:hypothetical protein
VSPSFSDAGRRVNIKLLEGIGSQDKLMFHIMNTEHELLKVNKVFRNKGLDPTYARI